MIIREKLQALMDKILKHFAGPSFADELRSAKAEFFDFAGHMDENGEQFELRMSQFFDWYFYTRDLSGYGHPPLFCTETARELRVSREEMALIDVMRAHRHSLFEFLKIKGNDVYGRDLLKNEKLVIRECPWTVGFSRDEIFDVRVLTAEGEHHFTRGFCFHPAQTKKFILGEVKKHQKDPDLNPEDMMLRLIKMRYKHEQYRHLDIGDIYTNDGKLGL